MAKVPAKPTHVNRLKSNVSGLHLPSKEWQDEQVKNFTEVRLKLTRHIAFVQNAPKSDGGEVTKFPSFKNEKGKV